MTRATKQRQVAIGRQRLERGETRQVRRWCAAAILASPVVGFTVAPLDRAAVSLSASVAILAALLLMIVAISSREIWRISESGVTHVRTWPLRRRVRLRWDDIALLYVSEESIGVRGTGKKCLLSRRWFEEEDWELAHDLVRAYLGETFDLDRPTAWDLERERCRSLSVVGHTLHWLRLVAIAIGISATLVLGGLLLYQVSASVAFYGSIALAVAWYCIGAFVAVRFEAARWRHR